MGKYIVIIPETKEAFSTDYFDKENHYVYGMIVIDALCESISFDGKNFKDIEEDYL